MRAVHVETGNPYDVTIGTGLLNGLGLWLKALTPARAAALVADDTVEALYGGQAARSLEAAGFRVACFRFPHGEGSKNLQTYGQLLDFLANSRLTRADAVVALGGGVTGDMAGFAAATYLRGVAVAQVPTTLLSMVDSSVGGKTGVNLQAGKNLAGAFHQPVGVLCDVGLLGTLPPETLADGMAEVIKYGLLCDQTLFAALESSETPDMESVVERCVATKAGVCAGDECDRGQRQLLNLGHTLGHAIERCSGYQTPHGHAVAVGMVYAARMAAYEGLCDAALTDRVLAVLARRGLPGSAPYPAEALAEAALGDKKRAGGVLTLVLPKSVGECVLHPVPVERLLELTRAALG